jgi:8-oxo-dGTP pyrophosphatase MutT (NUDIX family)
MTDPLIRKLELALGKELPGQNAQALMAPSLRPGGRVGYDGSHPQLSGVMILLIPEDGDFSTVFIHRSSRGPHGGQISLPGGKKEKNDPDLVYTALRETAEEIGIRAETVRVLGKLTQLYVPHSNYLIYPVVGIINDVPEFYPDEIEVEEIIKVRLATLYHPSNRKTMTLHRPGMDITAPYYDASGHRVWGATAMIMSEFEQVFISCIS